MCSVTINPELLQPVDTSGREIEEGDFVMVCSDIAIVKPAQQAISCWEENLTNVCFLL